MHIPSLTVVERAARSISDFQCAEWCLIFVQLAPTVLHLHLHETYQMNKIIVERNARRKCHMARNFANLHGSTMCM